MQLLADQSAGIAEKHAHEEVADAARETVFAEYLTLSIAFAVILVLIGSAVFGAMTIARRAARPGQAA